MIGKDDQERGWYWGEYDRAMDEAEKAHGGGGGGSGGKSGCMPAVLVVLAAAASALWPLLRLVTGPL